MTFHPQTPRRSPSRYSPVPSPAEILASVVSASLASGSSGTLLTPAHSVNGATSQADVHMMDDSPHKRKRPLDDIGGAGDYKKLHLDVGEKYLLCKTPHPEALPQLTEDLFEKFGLTEIAAEVAREKPNGEKNALRKTFKGHIKRLGVAGHFDVQRKPEEAPSEFLAMVHVPDLEWNVHQVKGREITNGLSESSLANLNRAVTLAKGPIPKAIWDFSVLGDLSQANQDASRSACSKPTAPSTPSASTPSAMARPKPQLSPVHDPARPRRSIKKRSYGEASFEGYGEGFPDDDAGLDTGYSTGEGEGRQKRRKRSSESSPSYSTMRQQSYGPGMVGA